MKPRRSPSSDSLDQTRSPTHRGLRDVSERGTATLHRRVHEAQVLTNARTLRDSVREAIRAEVAPDGDSGFYRPSGNGRGSNNCANEKLHQVLEWEKRIRRNASSSADLSVLKNQLEYALRSQAAYEDDLRQLLDLPSHITVEITKIPKPMDMHQEVRGFCEVRNQVLERAKLPFAIDYPLSDKSELWLGGVSILPKKSPGLVVGLLDIVVRQKQQTVVFAERYKESQYYVATSKWNEGRLEKPLHLYRLVCGDPRPLIFPIADASTESPLLRQILDMHRY